MTETKTVQRGWSVVFPARDPSAGLRAAIGAGSLESSFDFVRSEITSENPEVGWSYEIDGEQVSLDEFRRRASALGATGVFKATADSGAAWITGSL